MRTIKLTLLSLATVAVISCKKEAADTAVEDAGTETAMTSEKETADSKNFDGIPKATPVVEEKVDPATAPIITFESGTYDLGSVKAGEKIERVIEFTNTGKGPLQIKNAKASCGCTVPEYSEKPIAPGKKGELKVSFKAPKTNGKQMKTVTLTTNTVKGKETFKISAMVTGGQEKQAPKPKPAPALPAPKLENPS